MSAFGSWPTPITSELIVSGAQRIGRVELVAGTPVWSAARPDDGGRAQLVTASDDGTVDLLPAGSNVRSAVHEYGGGDWWSAGDRIWYVEWSDQRIYTLRLGDDAAPSAITADSSPPRSVRWADGDVHPDRQWIAAVRETHDGDEATDVRNEIVAIGATGGEPQVLVSGADFVASPRWSPDGTRLAWVQWSHPDMPWDGTELCVAAATVSDGSVTLGDRLVVAGRPDLPPGGTGSGESINEPRWAPDGRLWFVSDRTDWWNLYRWTPGSDPSDVEALAPVDGETTVPHWVFANATYAPLDAERAVVAVTRDGLWSLQLRRADGTLSDLGLPYTAISSVRTDGDRVVAVAASPTAEPAAISFRIDAAGTVTDHEVLSPRQDLGIDTAWFSTPEPIAFPTANGRTAYALYYPPTNPTVTPPNDELPPLIVKIHGGPTSAARPQLSLGIQFWTSRGFGVADVNYGGSTGYGRMFRNHLRQSWGVVDVADCEAAARSLAASGRVDGDRLCITGGSAGGFTTMAAMAFGDTFAAGASHYGVADLELLATDTHKFESRYLDSMVGPYPAERQRYRDRSPIDHLDGFDRPLIVLQGLEDEVVPPNQAEAIVAALRERAVPVAYVTFPGEQHGFRQAANIRAALDSELSFYAQVFGFELPPDEHIDPVTIDNLGSRR